MKFLSPIALVVFAFQSHAAPAIGVTRITPMTAIIGTPSQVSISASISDTSVIATSVNLLQLNADGSTTILGALHDDGLNGDLFAGDGVFTQSLTLNAATPSDLRFQVTAAFKGVLQRVKSPVLDVFFQPADAPQQRLAILSADLSSGNLNDAMNFILPSTKTTAMFNSFNQQELATIAGIFANANLVATQGDLKILNSSVPSASGGTTIVEITMVPDSSGAWVVNTW